MPKALELAAQGIASLSGLQLQPKADFGVPVLQMIQAASSAHGQPAVSQIDNLRYIRLPMNKRVNADALLHIQATEGPSVGSWRARVFLEPGRYRLEGELRAASVVPVVDGQPQGAGLRISAT